jgi:hypothetical protein
LKIYSNSKNEKKTENKNPKTGENRLTDIKPIEPVKNPTEMFSKVPKTEKNKNLKLLLGRPKKIKEVCVKLKSITTGDD